MEEIWGGLTKNGRPGVAARFSGESLEFQGATCGIVLRKRCSFYVIELTSFSTNLCYFETLVT